jgi:hypothetical protein
MARGQALRDRPLQRLGITFKDVESIHLEEYLVGIFPPQLSCLKNRRRRTPAPVCAISVEDFD